MCLKTDAWQAATMLNCKRLANSLLPNPGPCIPVNTAVWTWQKLQEERKGRQIEGGCNEVLAPVAAWRMVERHDLRRMRLARRSKATSQVRFGKI